MAFYGLQPSELRGLSRFSKLLLARYAEQINARRRLDMILDMRLVQDDSDAGRDRLANLSAMAFADDEATKAAAIEALTRRA